MNATVKEASLRARVDQMELGSSPETYLEVAEDARRELSPIDAARVLFHIVDVMVERKAC